MRIGLAQTNRIEIATNPNGAVGRMPHEVHDPFARQLRHTIDIARTKLRTLAMRCVTRRVDRRGRSKENVADAKPGAAISDVLSTESVHPNSLIGMGVAIRNEVKRREMEYSLRFVFLEDSR